MKKVNFCIFYLVTIFCLGNVQSQISHTPWQIHEGTQGVVQHANKFNGDPGAYVKAKIPTGDSGWTDAPTDANGNVNINRRSALNCLKQLDFTYFRTSVNVPNNVDIKTFSVSYSKADDGARIYIFNSAHPNGAFDPKADLILKKQENPGAVDLKRFVKKGEVNTVVIVQFDDCASGNTVNGIHINVNGTKIETKETDGAVSNPNKARTINYGDVIHLQNGWNNNQGGFLDTRGYQKDYAKTGNFLCVSTATENNRGGGNSGTWKVLSATGKAIGSPVLVNDDIHLLNQWNGNGGYLDTRGYQKDYAKTGNFLCVSTATAANRDSGSGTWKIISATGSEAGTPVTLKSKLHLQNGWNKFQGGYLDTRGYQKDYAKTGNLLCVSTATGPKRDGGSGTWIVKRVRKASKTRNKHILRTGEVLKSGERLTSKNGKFILRMQEDDGHLCIYKYENGKQGGFVWGSGKHGFKNGMLIMQDDGNLCVYEVSNGKKLFKWDTYDNNNYALGANYKLTLTNKGTLKIVNPSGAIMWENK